MNSYLTTTVALVSLSLLSGCPLIQVELDLPEVCLTMDAIDVDGSTGTGAMSIERNIDITERVRNIQNALAEQGVTNQLELVSFAAHIVPSAHAPSDFRFVDQLSVTLPASGQQLGVTLVDCTDCGSDDSSVWLDLPRIDMRPYAERETISIDVALMGNMPAHSWQMSADLCFSAQLGYSQDL